MRALKWLLLLGVVLALILLWPQKDIPGSFYEPHPVLAVPPERRGDLLPVDDFIGRTARPVDPYSYPISLGEAYPLDWAYPLD